MKKLLCYLFIARVLIPMHAQIYDNVVEWKQFSSEIYILTLTDGTKVIAPTMWTVIDEVKK